MFALTPLAVALHGIGYGSLLTALQGLWAVTTMQGESLGVHAKFEVRRSTRRARYLPYIPPEVEEARACAEEDEALLLELML